MGIYDRDYIRKQPAAPRYLGASRSGMGGMRMWSMTTWLIIINCAVFVVNGFLPVQWVQSSFPYPMQGVAELPADYEFDTRVGQIPPTTIGVRLRVVDATTKQQVGWVEFQKMNTLTAWLHFSTWRGFVGLEVWRLLGFQFLHANMTHLLFNMIGLFFFGPIVEGYLGRKRYLAFYLLAGICGALMYLILNLAGFVVNDVMNLGVRIPGLLLTDPHTPLVGASAGVFGILMAGAFLAPNAIVLLFFIIPMRLKWLAYGLVVLSIFTILTAGNNAGGEAGHLGGAIAGFYFIRHPHHLHGFFDILGYADPTSHHYRKHDGKREGGGARMTKRDLTDFREVDRILAKISEQGMGALTPAERETLRRVARRDDA